MAKAAHRDGRFNVVDRDDLRPIHQDGVGQPAQAAAQQALALDDGLAEAHASLAYIKAYYDWDWSGAEREFRRSLAVNPSYAAAHHSYSRLLAAMGRTDEALAEIQGAEQVEPVSTILQANTAMILFFARRL